MRNVKQTIYGLAIVIALLAALPAIGGRAKGPESLSYPELPDFTPAKPEIYTMPNGMTVYLLEDHELPIVNVTARIRTGSNLVPGDKVGLGSIFGQVQREGGTKSMTGDEMDDFLEARDASIETGMGGDVATASMDCLVEDFDDVFALFNDVLREPAFREDKIQLAQVQINTGIARRNDNVGAIVGREFARLIYGPDSPLARLTEYATVASVTQTDLLEWHARYYHPNAIQLGVVGDFDSAEMKKKIERTMGDWQRGPDIEAVDVAYRKDIEPGVYFIPKEDVTQAYVRMGHLGILRKNPDYFAVQVLNEVLGGGFSGRLMQNVRSDQGLAYSVFGGVGSDFLRPGIFQAGLSTKSSTMAESVGALREQLVGIIENPPTASELALAKESILNSFIFNYTSRAGILGQQMRFAYYGLPEDYLDSYRPNIEKVSAEDVARVAKKYIHPDRVVLLVVGNPADFDKPVSTFGSVQEIDISIPPPPGAGAGNGHTGTDGEVAQAGSAAAATEEASGDGRAVLQRMAKALNGTSKVPFEGISVKSTMKFEFQGQSMESQQELHFQLPDKARLVGNTSFGTQVVVLNGTEGGMIHPGQGNMELNTTETENNFQYLRRELLLLSKHANDEGMKVSAAGKSEVDGAPCDSVDIEYRGTVSNLCIDAKGMALSQSFDSRHPFTGQEGRIEMRYAAYEPVEGFLVPRDQTLVFGGQPLASVRLNEVDINPEFGPTMFVVPRERKR